MKKRNIPTVKEKSNEFATTIQNKYSQLVDEMNENKSLNDNITNVVLESALEVGGKASKRKLQKIFNNNKRPQEKT